MLRAPAKRGNCAVVGCTNQHKSLHGLPALNDIKAEWIKFIFDGHVPVMFAKTLYVCANHFKSDCFTNLGQYNLGLASKLFLKEGSIPSVRGEAVKVETDTGSSSCRILHPVRHVASQTDPPKRNSVSTQLSMKTLQNHVRSKATQTSASSRDCGVGTLTFPLDSPLLFLQPTIVKTPAKRPRLSLAHEEEGPSECSLSVVVREPEDST